MRLATRLQGIVPQHRLSRWLGALAACERPFVARPLMVLIERLYRVDLTEAARTQLADYVSFNDFFTRELAPGTRPLPAGPGAVAAPADGTVCELGTIEAGTAISAKGRCYSLAALLGDDPVAAALEGATFASMYLAPRDYHRVHMPMDGRLVRYVAVPGSLYSVNARTHADMPDLFARNERLVMVFETARGPLAVVMVGAMIVASIDTGWGGPRSPYPRLERTAPPSPVPFARGDELGRFLMGSTVVICGPFDPAGAVALGEHLKMGTAIGCLRPGPRETP